MYDPRCAPDPLGIISIHASAVTVGSQALIFLGPSETGKSTICQLLTTYTHMQAVADDIIYFIPHAGDIWEVANGDGGRASRGPLTEEEASTLKGFPLFAIFRLYQAATPHIEQIDNLAGNLYLANAFFEVSRHRHSDVETKKRAFAELAAIARSIQCYDFFFDQSPRTARVLTTAGIV